jgi:DNA-binding LacI/PurR family transcriptional regulator
MSQHPGGRRVTMRDVAEAVGVSTQTVSRVLNDAPAVRPETRAAVLECMRRLGFRPNLSARALALGYHGRIGVTWAVEEAQGVGPVVTAVQEAAGAAGLAVGLAPVARSCVAEVEAAHALLLDEGVDALVVVTSRGLPTSPTPPRGGPSVPRVVVGPAPLDAAHDRWVLVDHEAGSHLTTRHLLDLGHRSVAHVAGRLGDPAAHQAAAGWLRAHREVGAVPGPVVQGDWSAASGYDAGRRLVEARVRAVAVADDVMALGLLLALHEAGCPAPTGMSVTGQGGSLLGPWTWPGLTSTTHDPAAVAAEVLRWCQHPEAVAGRPVPPPRLVVRGSSVAAAACRAGTRDVS